MSAQDFSNLLEGGLVSFSTLSNNTIQALQEVVPGSFIAVYQYNPLDKINITNITGTSAITVASTIDNDNNLTSIISNHNTDSESTAMITTTTTSTSEPPNTHEHEPSFANHCIYVNCWKNYSRTINVQCGKKGNIYLIYDIVCVLHMYRVFYCCMAMYAFLVIVVNKV